MTNGKTAYLEYPDEELMKLVIQGDQHAFGLIYDRYANTLLGYFYRMLWQDREKAEDFVQDFFMKIISKPELYQPGRPFKTWMFSVANNMCKNEYKKASVRREAAGEILRTTEVSTPREVLMDRIEQADFNEALEAEVQQLEPIHRDVFILRYRQDLAISDISKVMNCSEGTVKSRLFYAVRKLASKLAHFNSKDTVPQGLTLETK